MANVISTLIGVLVGTLATWGVAHIYYRRAGEELKEEAEKLRKLSVVLLRGLENAGLMKLSRNESGEIMGLAFELKVGGGSLKSSGGVVDMKVIKKPSTLEKP